MNMQMQNLTRKIQKTFLNSEKIAIICEFIEMNGP